MNEILSYIIPVVTIIISNYLGRRSQEITTNKENKMQRYDIAYIPILNRLIIDLPNSPNFIVSENSAIFYTEIILNNLHYYENETWANFQPFYNSYLEYIGHIKVNPDAQAQSPYINIFFRDLIMSILKEGSELSRELSLPDISAFLYSQIQQDCKPAKG